MKAAHIVLASVLGTTSGACKLLGGPGLVELVKGEPAAGSTSGGSGDGSGGDSALRDPGTEEVRLEAGANLFRCTIRYEAAEGETWAFDSGFHCPPEYSERPYADDDPKPPPEALDLPASVPGWCSAYTGWGAGSSWMAGGLGRPRTLPEPAYPDTLLEASTAELLEVARFIGVAACDRKHYRPRQQWVAYWKAHWLEATHLGETEMQVLMSELVADESATALAARIGCKRGPLVSALTCDEPEEPPTAEHLDRSELGGKVDPRDRVAYLLSCRSASCGVDAAAVDWREAAQLVRQDTDLAILRFVAQRGLAELQQTLEQRRTQWGEHAQLAIAAADELREHVEAEEPAVLGSALAVVTAAQAGEAIDSCPEGLDAAVQARLSATESLSALSERLEDPVTQILLRASTLCEEDPRLQQVRAHALERVSTQWLGPRRAARVALEEGVPRLPVPVEGRDANGAEVVASVKTGADGTAIVRFEPERFSDEVESCRETNQVDAINADGTLVYRQRCRVVGYVAVKVTPDPLRVTAAEGAMLSKGAYVRYVAAGPRGYEERRDGKVVDPAGDPRDGVVVEVHRSEASHERGEAPTVWLGYPLGQ